MRWCALPRLVVQITEKSLQMVLHFTCLLTAKLQTAAALHSGLRRLLFVEETGVSAFAMMDFSLCNCYMSVQNTESRKS